MSSIHKDELNKVIKLSHLEMSDEEADGLLNEFEDILTHVSKIQELPPKAMTGLKATKAILRLDEEELPDHFHDQDSIIQAFPERNKRQAKVPPILNND